MKPAETARILEKVQKHWGRPQPPDALEAWTVTLAGFTVEQVAAALNRLAGREFPPHSGTVAAEIRTQLQGPPLGFDAMLTVIARAVPGRLYRGDGQITAADTAEAVAHLQARGVHETACRFVAQHGLRAVWLIPCGDLEPLDIGQDANRRDMARSYEWTTIKDWERDRAVGVGLDRACRRAELDPTVVLELADAHVRALSARQDRPALPTADVADEPTVEIDFGQLLADRRAERARRETARGRERHAQRLAEREQRAAAERELAEHRSVIA